MVQDVHLWPPPSGQPPWLLLKRPLPPSNKTLIQLGSALTHAGRNYSLYLHWGLPLVCSVNCWPGEESSSFPSRSHLTHPLSNTLQSGVRGSNPAHHDSSALRACGGILPLSLPLNSGGCGTSLSLSVFLPPRTAFVSDPLTHPPCVSLCHGNEMSKHTNIIPYTSSISFFFLTQL